MRVLVGLAFAGIAIFGVDNNDGQVLKHDSHERVGILCTLFCKGARDNADDTNCHSAQLCILMGLQSGVEVGKEGWMYGAKLVLRANNVLAEAYLF
jgi:hypothetical protein